MRFGKCKKCRKYKYLEEEATCVSCLEAPEGDWMVLRTHPVTGQQVYQDDLTKEKAQEIARASRFLTATKKAIA